MKSLTSLALAATSLALLAGAASAATVFPTESGTTLNLTFAGSTQTFSAPTASGDGYYYTFTTAGRYLADVTDTGNNNAAVVFNPFTITTGSVAGAGTLLATSVAGTFASEAKLALAAGTYTLYVPTTVPGQALSGTISVAAVPEPAAWALMIVGFAGIGGAIRRRQQLAAIATA